jgi:hypothetical protein
MYNPEQLEFLKARSSYVWWMTEDEAMRYPARIIGQIMGMGSTEDVGNLEGLFSKDELAEVLLNSAKGRFDRLSWNSWSLRLGLVRPGGPPLPMPERRIGPDESIPDHKNAMCPIW